MTLPSDPIPFPSLSEYARSGIYFLHFRGEVVYVGQAVDMRRRIGQHISEGTKSFDAISYAACEPERLAGLERRYIDKLLPLYNRCHRASRLKAEINVLGLTANQPQVGSHIIDDCGAADFLGITIEHFRALQATGQAPRPRRMPRSKRRRYTPHDLRQFAAQHRELLATTPS